LNARSGDTISALEVYDSGCAESRVRELTGHIIEEYVAVDLKRHAKEYMRNFEPVPPYPLDNNQIVEKFGSIAREEALKILEQEKKNVADFRSPHIQLILKTYIKQLKYVLLDDGHPFKAYAEETMRGDSFGNNPIKTAVSYTRSEIIQRWEGNLAGEKDFRPYLNVELQALWREADALASQGHLLSKEELKAIEKTAKAQ